MFKTKRLTIRLFKETDLEDVTKIFSDPEVCQYMAKEVWTEATAKELFQPLLNGYEITKEKNLCFAVEYKKNVIGEINFRYNVMRETAEIGYGFLTSVKGQGLASEAVAACIKYVLHNLGYHRIFANIDPRNPASAKLCERVGMRKEAHFIKDYWLKGEWTDSYIYAILQEEI